jgi:HAMP domain-containing protein
MKAFEDGLEDLKKERNAIEEDIANANTNLQRAQQTLGKATSRRQDLESRIAPLRRLLDEIAAGRLAIKTQKQAAEQEIKDGEKSHAELFAQISKELSAARRKEIQAAIDAVDTLHRQIFEASASIAEEQKRVAVFEGSLRETLAQLRKLPNEIKTARDEAAKLNAAARSAAGTARLSEGYYLVHELKQRLETLSKLAGAETDLMKQLDEEWKEPKAAKARIIDKTAELNQFRNKLIAAGRELQDKRQHRKADNATGPGVAAKGETRATTQQPKSSVQRTTDRHLKKVDDN